MEIELGTKKKMRLAAAAYLKIERKLTVKLRGKIDNFAVDKVNSGKAIG